MAYHYGHPANDAVAEADFFLNNVFLLALLEPTDLLVLDLETGDGLSQVEVNRWAKVWAGRVQEAAGRKPVLYCGHAYMENQTGVGLNGPFSAWWYPRYPSSLANEIIWPETFTPTLPSPNAWGGPPDWWQFSSTFPSVEGVLDANVYNGTLAQLRAINQG
jgi:GH25 family lysozyme M1 (1,4-beta-N-acetylmuramidase)